MGAKTKKLLALTPSNASCEFGPIVKQSRNSLLIAYDSEGDSGEIDWSVIKFDGVIAVRFTPEFAVTEEAIDAYSRVCEVNDSRWVRDLKDNAQKRFQMVRDEVRHMIVFFDHFGCFEVACVDVEFRARTSVGEAPQL